MKTTNEIAQAAWDEISAVQMTDCLADWDENCIGIITKAIESATVQGEPVAWRVSFSGGMTWTLFYEYPAQIVIEASHQQILIEPLYTAPPKRQPLTIEAIWEVVCATAKDGEVDAPSFEEFMSEPDVENVIAFFRRIEAAINGD